MTAFVQLLMIFLIVIIMFSVINFLAISLSQHSFKRRIVAGFVFLLLTPIVFLTTTAFASIFNKGGFSLGALAFIIAGIYILNGIAILLSSTFIIKKT
ncbi:MULTISPECIES: hypothetical protein [Bacillus]|uniref:Uncharacterized protein n=2 Tax=Bacillus cereus group TaxID=86661 RepID=A0A2C1D768_BACCE|nr:MULTISPECIES: hypothetical protein [Bacillus cereus group]OFD78335.1 hypothetical protein BWGOE8_28450 [Bacillus mycoides]OFD78730.1 hypothetical protein BWGOE9_28690 [Bacillus mycoides]OFD80496.1 hypothetical protein BWGOE10_28480 [Bacillus mycoides]PGS96236.1 hypothetical protein COD09_22080 [Bacillus cereus]